MPWRPFERTKIVSSAKIPKFSPDGRTCTQWTGFFEYPHFGLLVHERSQIFTAAVNIDRTKREFVTNLSLKGSYMSEK